MDNGKFLWQLRLALVVLLGLCTAVLLALLVIVVALVVMR